MECMKLLKIIVMFLNLVRGVWKKKNDLKHCKWNFQIDTGFQIRPLHDSLKIHKKYFIINILYILHHTAFCKFYSSKFFYIKYK